MNWIIITVASTFCFTMAFITRYREQSIDYREKMIKDKEEYQEELVKMLVLIQEKDARIEELERQFC